MDLRRLSTKILSIILCAVMMLSVMPLDIISVFASSETVPVGYIGIYDIEDLYLVRYNLEGNYILMADIDLTVATAEGGEWDSGSGWAPIGEKSAPFKGIFDGNGHKITGMHIKNTSVTHIGLFGYINGGTIKNLRMVNSDIQDSSVHYAGTIAGFAYNTTIENIAVDNLKMNVIRDTFGGERCFGGIVGHLTGSSSGGGSMISKSYVSGTITATGSYNYVGGIVGGGATNLYAKITDCYNVAKITAIGEPSYMYAGGISGNYCTITHCVNVGIISGMNFRAGSISYEKSALSECYYLRGTSSNGQYDIIDTYSTAVAVEEEQMILPSVFDYLDFENTWFIDVSTGCNYPQLISCPQQKPVASISLTVDPQKTSYLQHDELDITGIKLNVTYASPFSETVTIPVTSDMISGYDATALGIQTVTVSYLGKTATFDVVVSPRPLTSVTLDKTSVILEPGMTEQLNVTVLTDNTTDKTFTWSSDNEKVATVDKNGLVTANCAGTAIITATAVDCVSAKATITVAADHIYGDTVTIITATCVADGVANKICYICGHVENIIIPVDSTNHTGETEIRNAVPADCVNNGYTGDTYCLGCNSRISYGSLIESIGAHSYEKIIIKEPTCIEKGLIKYICSVCGDIIQASAEIPMIPHTEEAMPDKAATCTQTGSRGGKRCSVCGTVTETPEEIPTTAHTPGEWQVIVDATADTDGMKIRCCTVCGAETDRETIPAGTTSDGKPIGYLGDANNDGKVTAADARLILRHSAKIEILPETVHHLADVNGDGKINASDARIALRMASKLEGLFYYGSGDFHAHEYETTIDAEATCTTDGKETKICKICGETKTSTIPKKGHAWKDATCTAPKTCTNCGATTGSGGYHYSDKNFRCTRCGKNLSGFTDSFI